MQDKRIENMANVLVNYSLKIKKNDLFVISGCPLTMPLITEVYKKALQAGGFPIVRLAPEGLSELFYKLATEDQLTFQNPISLYEAEKMDAYLTIWGDYNTREYTNIDPLRIKKRTQSREKEIKTFDRRIDNQELRWCGTQFPTHADAQEANMSLSDYEDFVYQACLVDQEDPIRLWETIKANQQKLVDILHTKSVFHVKALDTDLTIKTNQRKWVNCCGDENFPDGEVFTSPVEDQINGHIRFSFPGIYQGREIEDIQLTFENGKVVQAAAKKGESLLQTVLDTDPGARYVGEFAMGTNYGIHQFTRNMLFDEKIGGTIHMAVGKGFEESESKNESLIHWDMLCDMRQGGEITADGELIYQNGKFLI